MSNISVHSFTISSSLQRNNIPRLHSTPFDLELYDDGRDLNESSNPFQPDDNEDEISLLAQDPSTKLVLGINKYSHDTTICAANAKTGEVLFALSKERITRKKHDGGNTAELVEICLDQLDLDVDSIVKVVMNNHHHRILPFIESNPNHMEWEEELGINGGQEDGYSDEYNLLTCVEDKIEMSHHLAHAYSAAAQCPFSEGMIVVMDGMGETFRTMKFAQENEDSTYVSDFTLNAENGCDNIQFVPADIQEKAKKSYFDWREAESVYTFTKDNGQLHVKVRSFLGSMTTMRIQFKNTAFLLNRNQSFSPYSKGSPRKKLHQHSTTTDSKIWTRLEQSTHVLHHISLETGMPAEK